jgi:peptidoglycan/LPS O-acetylase OafA/YrhL
MKLTYYKYLDSLRGIAALMVVIFHFFVSPNVKYLTNLDFFKKITNVGHHGVSLFFVLSGFVITRILINDRANNNFFSNFYWKRILRIFPLYYTYLIFSYYLVPLFFNENITDFRLQLPYYLYYQNLFEVIKFDYIGPGHYWTLMIEEHFYMFWPLFIYFVKPNNLIKYIVFYFLIILLVKYFMLSNGFEINHFTLTRVDQLMFGAILSILEFKGFFYKKKALICFFLIGISLIPISLSISYLSKQYIYIQDITKNSLLGLLFFSILGIFIIVELKYKSSINMIGKIFQYLGKISFGVYIWHMLVLHILNKIFIVKIWYIDFFITMILTIIVAHISYFYFEKYFLEKKDRNRLVQIKLFLISKFGNTIKKHDY